MPDLRGLTILVATTDRARFQAALSLAAAQAALGGRARVHLHGEAIALFAPGIAPDAAELRGECLALGVTFSACQSGLDMTGLSFEELGQGIEPGGLVGLLGSLGEDRLVSL